ncbi:MAG: AAA family ATPase [Micrococcus sp.]|nr:AAA family ATPase [Micrococcus sp.]
MHPGSPEFTSYTDAVMERVSSSLDGKPKAVRTATLVLLAGGHLLLEDVPGVGKTLLARSLGAAVGGQVHRIQFTPDLLPADITGVSVFHQDRHDFEFRPGPVFAHIVIADEINRASAKTQAALLEAMEEHRVSVDGVSHRLPEPFMVVATQNPLDSHGTYPLPEAQRDRFLARISLGYPDADAEVQMLAHHSLGESHDTAIAPVIDVTTLSALQASVRQVALTEPLRRYLVDLARATRSHSAVRVGASPRSVVQWAAAARAEAALNGRDYTVPDDVRAVAVAVLAHRLLLDTSGVGQAATDAAVAVVDDVLTTVPGPSAADSPTRRRR